MLRRLFERMFENYDVRNKKTRSLVPRSIHESLIVKNNQAERSRLLCDYIAGMTDHHATRIYRRLFDPTYGSLVDLV